MVIREKYHGIVVKTKRFSNEFFNYLLKFDVFYIINQGFIEKKVYKNAECLFKPTYICVFVFAIEFNFLINV